MISVRHHLDLFRVARSRRKRAGSYRTIGFLRRPFQRLLTSFYEQRLERLILSRPVPAHIGIILDGNRRFAREMLLDLGEAPYELGAEKLDDLLEWCSELRISAVTLWVLSTQNLARAPGEVSSILAAVEDKVGRLILDPEIHRQEIRVRVVGRLELLPASTRSVLETAQTVTSQYRAMTLTIAVAYGGHEEIADAVRALLNEQLDAGITLAEGITKVTPAAIARHLYSVDLPDPDLIIRTSGEIRLSGFLLWQSAYSEFYFTDVYWPAFRKIDFLRAVRSYQQRQRRFGL